MNDAPNQPSAISRPHHMNVEPGRLIGRGHPAGDFLEAYNWVVTDETHGRIVVDAHLPDQVLNPRGQLFGGFTPTYIDLICIYCTRAGPDRLNPSTPRNWLSTINMRVDYYEPVVQPGFTLEAHVEHRRGKTWLVVAKMTQNGKLATHAITTLRSLDSPTH